MPDIETYIARLKGDPDDLDAATALAAVIGSTADAVRAELQPLLHLPDHPDGAKGEVWENHSGNQRTEPLQIFKPDTLLALVGIVNDARRTAVHTKVRAVATGFSVSDVATTEGFLVDTCELDKSLPVESLRPGVDGSHLYRFEAGLTLADLNARLDNLVTRVDDHEAIKLGIPNMPSASKLTFVGGMMTASHGSGISTGTLASQVRSLVLVASDGVVYRIEPSEDNGAITDRAAHEAAHPNIILKQDDDWFYSVIVSFGCMGLVYSVTIECVDKFWLSETRTESTWAEVKKDLRHHLPGELPAVLTDNLHYEVLLNPYLTDGTHTTLVTVRNKVKEPDAPPVFNGHRNWLTQMLASVPISDSLLVAVLNVVPSYAPTAIDLAIKGMEDNNVIRVSHELLDLGSPATMDAYAIEIAFPWEQGTAAADAIITLAAKAASSGERFHNSPISLRFVAAEKAYLAPHYGEATCVIELPILVGSEAGYDLLRRVQTSMYALGGRPHWGLELDLVSDAGGLVGKMYERFETFREVFDVLNSEGLFDNRTTLRLGLTKTNYRR